VVLGPSAGPAGGSAFGVPRSPPARQGPPVRTKPEPLSRPGLSAGAQGPAVERRRRRREGRRRRAGPGRSRGEVLRRGGRAGAVRGAGGGVRAGGAAARAESVGRAVRARGLGVRGRSGAGAGCGVGVSVAAWVRGWTGARGAGWERGGAVGGL